MLEALRAPERPVAQVLNAGEETLNPSPLRTKNLILLESPKDSTLQPKSVSPDRGWL